jgi:hypothetical protein
MTDDKLPKETAATRTKPTRLTPPAGLKDVTSRESGTTFTLIGTEAFRRTTRKNPKD